MKDEIEPLGEARSSSIKEDITPKDLLKFAKWILFVIALFFLFGCISELILPKNMVFEICKTTLPAFASLIIGYYFGKA